MVNRDTRSSDYSSNYRGCRAQGRYRETQNLISLKSFVEGSYSRLRVLTVDVQVPASDPACVGLGLSQCYLPPVYS